MSSKFDRAEGCLLGQLIGDALGSQVEFQSPDQIKSRYPFGVRNLEAGGTWNTLAGQPTDDSELALALARSIVAQGGYDQSIARSAYEAWYRSGPFDIGNTVSAAMRGTPDYDSQSNGALMRVSPLGALASRIDEDLAARHAREDAWITHPNEVTQDANVVFVLTLGRVIRDGLDAQATYRAAVDIAVAHGVTAEVRVAIETAAEHPPASFMRRQGWVLIALQNAMFQLLHADSPEEALIDTVGRGGDTDTTGAICGALLGAVYGRAGFPDRWVDSVLSCRPIDGAPGVHRPRPKIYWPCDVLDLARMIAQP